MVFIYDLGSLGESLAQETLVPITDQFKLNSPLEVLSYMGNIT